MIRRIAPFAALLALTCCATRPASPPPAEQPKPQAVDVRVCAKISASPAMPDTADLVQPETAAEKSAFNDFMTWVAQLVDHDKVATDQAELARRQSCPK